MPGVPGKNKVEKGFRISVDDSGTVLRELTGDLVPGSCKGGGIVYDQIDMTGASNAVKNALAGQGEATISAKFYANDTATTGALTVIKSANGLVGTVTLQWGSNGAAPSTGDPQFSGEYLTLMGSLGFEGGKAVFDVTFVPGSSVAPAWGTVP